MADNLGERFKVIADIIEKNRFEIIDLLTDIETRKTAVAEIEKTVRMLRSFDQEDEYLIGMKPVGRVAVFLPFNMPLYSLTLYAFGPLYAGNEVFVRPSRLTGKALLKIWDIISHLTNDLPIYFIECNGREYVECVTRIRKTNAIIFTGKWDSVKDIAKRIESDTKLIYCGSGVCPFIVREDANIELAVNLAVQSRIFNSGQDCLATEKFIVHKSVSAAFIKSLVEKVKMVKVGENKSPDTDIGPLIASEFVERIKELISESKGVQHYFGGITGNVVGPIVYQVTLGDALLESEKFAPVFTIATYESDAEVIEYLNQSDFKMGISVFGSQFNEAEINWPQIAYNTSIIDVESEDLHRPFGGGGMSGFILYNGLKREGPILFSQETSTIYEREGTDMLLKKMFVNGEWVEARSGKTFESINPATGKVIAIIPDAQEDDVDFAVRAARSAYESEWSKTDPATRSTFLFKVAELIESNADELARLDMIDAGKPFLDCQFDIPACVEIFRFNAGLTDKILGATYPVQQNSFAFSKREPYGIVGAIVPWNYPIYNACLKVAPILAMGNCCILKPAELTSLSALKLAEIIQQAGIPNGVFNVLTGLGESTGAALSAHNDVDMISFTGSTDVGRKIMVAAANSNLKRLSLELGGKSPFIIFNDANFRQAVDSACLTIFYNQGQTCTAGSRLLVQHDIKEAVEKAILDKVKNIVVGNPESETVHMGAIVSTKQYEKVLRYIELGKKEGANLLFGGNALEIEGCESGYFVSPTVFTDVKNYMGIAQEEIFGPVMSIIEFETEEEAIAIANDVSYGLATSIWTQSSSRVLRLANRINAGIVWSNCVAKENVCVPVGGFKQSGFGKESGVEAGFEYTRQKTVWINTSDEFIPWIE